MQKKFWLVVALAAAVSPVAARAQGGGAYVEGHDTFITGTTVGGTGTKPTGNTSGIGATFGAFYDFYHFGPINLGGDARYSFSHNGSGSHFGNELNYGAVNLRVSGALPVPKFPVHPYAQAGVLGASTNYAYYSSMRGGFGVDYQFGADVDLLPHLDFRAEYSGGHVSDLRSTTSGNASLNFNSIQGGFVIWFGRD